MCAERTEHFEVDEKHALGSAFGLEKNAFLSVEDAADDTHPVSLVEVDLVGTEILYVRLHLGGCVNETLHLIVGHMENLV